jgi:hypothetical protein
MEVIGDAGDDTVSFDELALIGVPALECGAHDRAVGLESAEKPFGMIGIVGELPDSTAKFLSLGYKHTLTRRCFGPSLHPRDFVEASRFPRLLSGASGIAVLRFPRRGFHFLGLLHFHCPETPARFTEQGWGLMC